MRVFRRLAYLVRQRRVEAELAEELELHRAIAQKRLEHSGLTAAEAETASRRVMGNITLAREDARAAWIAPWLDDAWQDVKYALRMFRRSPAATAALVWVLAIGIGPTTAVFALVDALVLRDLPVSRPDRLAYFSSPSFSYPIFNEVRSRGTAVFSSVAAWSVEDMHVAWQQTLEPADVLVASGEFYSTIGIQAAVGRTFSDGDDRPGGGAEGRVAVISYSAWQRRYGGSPSVLGRAVRVGPDTYTIIGVTPRGFFGVTPGMAPELTIPLTSSQDPSDLQSATSNSVHLLARLRDGVTLAEANAGLTQFWTAALDATLPANLDASRRAYFLGRKTSLESARAGFSRVRNRFAEPLWFLFGLVALLMAVSCASAANLFLAREAGRRREMAVRLAIGAGRARILRQTLTESLVLTLIASMVGLVLASWGAGALVALLTTREQTIHLDAAISGRVTAFSIALAAVTSLFCSVLPSLAVTRLDPGSSLREGSTAMVSRHSRWLSARPVVVMQVAISVLLLTAAALFGRSLTTVLSQDAGVDRANVVVVAADVEAAGYDDARAAAFYQELLQRVRALPDVESASISMYPPLSGGDGAWTQNIGIDGGAPAQGTQTVYFNTVSTDFFRAAGMRILRGRDVAESDTGAAPRVVLVNETLARRYFHSQDPLGRSITIGRDKTRANLRIIGVVTDAKYQRLQEEPRAVAYLPWLQQRGGNLFVEVRTAATAAIGEQVGREVQQIDGTVPLQMQTVADRIRESLVTERVLAMLATVLALAAVTLACAGLYGVLALAVSRRTPEIGLRLALGADRRLVLLQVFRESAMLSGAGIGLGAAATLAFGKIIRGLLFQVTPTDPGSIVGAAVLMFAVALLAGLAPAWRAARVDPLTALRHQA